MCDLLFPCNYLWKHQFLHQFFFFQCATTVNLQNWKQSISRTKAVNFCSFLNQVAVLCPPSPHKSSLYNTIINAYNRAQMNISAAVKRELSKKTEKNRKHMQYILLLMSEAPFPIKLRHRLMNITFDRANTPAAVTHWNQELFVKKTALIQCQTKHVMSGVK